MVQIAQGLATPGSSLPPADNIEPRDLRVWLDRRYVDDEMVHETLSLTKMAASDLAALRRHYRVETIEFAPVSTTPTTAAGRDTESLAYVIAHGLPSTRFDDDQQPAYGYAHLDRWLHSVVAAIDDAVEADLGWQAKRSAAAMKITARPPIASHDGQNLSPSHSEQL